MTVAQYIAREREIAKVGLDTGLYSSKYLWNQHYTDYCTMYMDIVQFGGTMRGIQGKINELQEEMGGCASKRDAEKLAEVLARHGVRDMNEVRQLSNDTLDDLMDEAEEE